MYGRVCNYRQLRKSEKISRFLGEQLEDNTQLQSAYPQCDLKLSDLLFNNRFCPLLQSTNFTSYTVANANFISLLEFRSRMGFKFLAFGHEYIKESESPKFRESE